MSSSDQQGWLAAACAALKRTLCCDQAGSDDTLSLLDHLSEGVLILDLSGHVIHANRAAHALFLDHAANMTGTTLAQLGIRDDTTIAFGTGRGGALGGISQVIEIRAEPTGRAPFPMEMSIVGGQYRGQRAVIGEVADTFTLDWLQAMLASHGLFPRQLELEINEKLLLEEGQGSDRWVSDLRAQGFSIVLDGHRDRTAGSQHVD